LGCKIDWKEGKDLSVSFNAANGKETSQDTFFTFFATPNDDGVKPSIRKILKRLENVNETKGDDDDEEDRDLDVIFSMDQEIGQFLKDVFIPKSTLYYIGALNENVGDLDDEDFQEYNEMGRGFDEDENDEEDDDDDIGDDIDDDEEDFDENDSASKSKKRKI